MRRPSAWQASSMSMRFFWRADARRLFHVKGASSEVDWYHGLYRVVSHDLFFGLPEVDVKGAWVYVREHWGRADIKSGVGRREKGQGRGKDLITGPETSGLAREVKGGRAVGADDSVLRASVGGELPFELFDDRALGKHPGGEDLYYGLDIVSLNRLTPVRYHPRLLSRTPALFF